DGAEAVARYQELRPEVTTLDITMPEKDGLEALREIIALDPSARVVMCSALGQEAKVLESIKLGAKEFVVKPFQAPRVLEAIGKALASPRRGRGDVVGGPGERRARRRSRGPLRSHPSGGRGTLRGGGSTRRHPVA